MQKGPYLVTYDRANDRRITSIDFGAIIPGTTAPEITVWIWNKKDFRDAPTATDVRVSASAANQSAVTIIQNKWLQVRVDGVMDPDETGIENIQEENYTPVGGSVLDPDDFHAMGDIPTNCARAVHFRIAVPEGVVLMSRPVFNIDIGYFSSPVKWLWASEEF